ncbi:argonaute 4-like protein, partial [Tanacetum coccineum]
IAQKNHHTKFFQPGSPDNAPPGTVIDNNHPRNNDFYMCAHARMIGTTRPTHYHVLYDEIGFSADDLQELVHSLSYVFYNRAVALFYEDGRPVDGKGVGRKVIDQVHETYESELAGKEFAYDGEKSLFTVGVIPRNKLEFTVVLEDVTSNRNNGNASETPENEDKKRMRRQYQSKTFKVELSFAAKIPMQAIAQAL